MGMVRMRKAPMRRAPIRQANEQPFPRYEPRRKHATQHHAQQPMFGTYMVYMRIQQLSETLGRKED